MAKFAAQSVLDALLDKVATGVRVDVCSSQPTTYAEATSTYSLANATLTSGDFTKAAGLPNGRQVTIASKTGVTIGTSGTVTHLAVCDGTTLLYVTTVTSQVLTSGNTLTIPAWKVTVSDPS